jgi:hypothetical protein
VERVTDAGDDGVVGLPMKGGDVQRRAQNRSDEERDESEVPNYAVGLHGDGSVALIGAETVADGRMAQRLDAEGAVKSWLRPSLVAASSSADWEWKKRCWGLELG